MPIRVETPKNLDQIFSLECFKFNEMKGLFRTIFEYLQQFEGQIDMMDNRLNNIKIPDFSKLMKQIQDLDMKVFEADKARRQLSDEFEQFKLQATEKFDEIHSHFTMEDDSLDTRITKLEEEVEELKKRPVATSDNNLDFSQFCTNDEFLNLMERVSAVEKRNLE